MATIFDLVISIDNISSNLCPEQLIIVHYYYEPLLQMAYNHKYQKGWVQIVSERVSNKSNTRNV
jgi:hypothetical protein